MEAQLVWFKRDLRATDHRPLQQALLRGPVVCLYVIEPALWREPDVARQHYDFLQECLHSLDHDLARLGLRLLVLTGDMPSVLEALHDQLPFQALHAHEETGNAFTFRRDLAVRQWCRDKGLPFHEYPQFGVRRGLKNRDRWQGLWEAHMAAPLDTMPDCPAGAPLSQDSPAWPHAHELGLDDDAPPHRQRGGRQRALIALDSFLSERCERYRGGISSPLSAPSACSRLSPYLAMGCLSMREVVQATRLCMARTAPDDPRHRGLQAFQSRLYWHCHFIQKLESEPELEWRNMHRGYDGLREADWQDSHFKALVEGRTGWPLVDACVAMLRDTGWLNFRMRAMLVSVAAYPLWLHWRPVGEWLARQFLDYEPGIHWSQMQMQSGTTGINATRIYNPIKQAQDHDPQGHFVRRWLPVMRRVPSAWLFEPWLMPPQVQARCGLRVGQDIPLPIVDLATATRLAKTRFYDRRLQPQVHAANAGIVRQHGSRMRRRDPMPQPRSGATDHQLTLGF